MQRAADGEAREDFDACPATLYLAPHLEGQPRIFRERAPARGATGPPERRRDTLLLLRLAYTFAALSARVLIIALREEEFYFTHAMHSGMPSLCLRPPPRMSLNCINNALALSPAKAMQQKALLLTCVCANNQIILLPGFTTCRIALCLFNLSALMRFKAEFITLSVYMP
jgi:hypothetical protein